MTPPGANSRADTPARQQPDIELRLLVEAIYLKYSYDFRDYSGASLRRRVLHAVQQLAWPPSRRCRTVCCTTRPPSAGCCQYLNGAGQRDVP